MYLQLIIDTISSFMVNDVTSNIDKMLLQFLI